VSELPTRTVGINLVRKECRFNRWERAPTQASPKRESGRGRVVPARLFATRNEPATSVMISITRVGLVSVRHTQIPHRQAESAHMERH
jgi:hypothetical protein